MKIVALEPYYGGSHKNFLKGLQANLPVEVMILSLPARKWKWRMRLAAPYFAEQLVSQLDKFTNADLLFCSSFVDVATLKSLLPRELSHLPVYTYFHENQFAYPVQKHDERDFHFGLTNLTTALASDFVAFNSNYNLQTFLTGIDQILSICPDMELDNITKKIIQKSSIINPGINFDIIDASPANKEPSDIPVIVWNHRWEHDKNPEQLFDTLFKLHEQNIELG
jgi:glycosyltransferase involved in cell wall biosynthesis